ncbi:MAG: hypothetical protein AAF913_10305 [Pseudomonadota bacterium]
MRFLCVLLVMGCALPPEGPARDYLNAGGTDAAYPPLLTQPSLAAALGRAPPETTQAALTARADALRTRAARLSGAVLTDAELRRLEEEVGGG